MSKVPTFFWSGYAHAMREGALFSLVNKEPTVRGRVISIEYFDVKPWTPQTHDGSNIAGINGICPYRISRVTAINEDGYDVPMNHTGGTTALPAQVKCRIQNSVTESDVFSQLLSLGHDNFTGGTFMGPFPGKGSHASSPLGVWSDGSAQVQPVVLREGTGLAIVPAGSATRQAPMNTVQWMTVTLRDETNSRTYVACCELVSTGAQSVASFVVFNGSGSGITLSVLSIEQMNSGINHPQLTVPNSIRYLVTRGDDGKGEVVTPLAADPTVSLPSWIRASRGRLGYHFFPKIDSTGLSIQSNVDPYGNPNSPYFPYYPTWSFPSQSEMWSGLPGGGSAIFSIGCLRRSQPHCGDRQPTSAETGFAIALAPKTLTSGNVAMNNDQIVIPPGRGFAVVANNSSGRNAFWIDIAFSWRQETTPYTLAFA